MGNQVSKGSAFSLGISDESKKKLDDAQNHVKAFWWTLFAAASFATMSYIVKVLSFEVHAQQIVLYRSGFNLICVFIICRILGTQLFASFDKLLIVRGLIGFTGLTCYYSAISRIPLSLAAVVINTSPLFSLISSRVILREKLPLSTMLWIFAAVGSMLFILLPGLGGRNLASVSPSVVWTGLAFCLAGAVISSLAHVTVRVATASYDSFTIVFYFALVSTICAIPFAIPHHEWASTDNLLLMIVTGITSTAGQFGAAQAFRYGKAGIVSAIGLCGPVFAILYGVFLLDEEFLPLQWVGVILFILSLAQTSRYRRPPAVEAPGRT